MDNCLVHFDKVYEVEKIINCKFYKNKKYYLIKWLCYPISESTWEPKSNIKHLSKIVQKFEHSYPLSIDNEMYEIYLAEMKKRKKRSKKGQKKEEIQLGTKHLAKKKKIEGFSRVELKDSYYEKLKNHLYINMAKRHTNKVENEVIIDLSSNSSSHSEEIGSVFLVDKKNLGEIETKDEEKKLIMPVLE
jgi:hypothetical protein